MSYLPNIKSSSLHCLLSCSKITSQFLFWLTGLTTQYMQDRINKGAKPSYICTSSAIQAKIHVLYNLATHGKLTNHSHICVLFCYKTSFKDLKLCSFLLWHDESSCNFTEGPFQVSLSPSSSTLYQRLENLHFRSGEFRRS